MALRVRSQSRSNAIASGPTSHLLPLHPWGGALATSGLGAPPGDAACRCRWRPGAVPALPDSLCADLPSPVWPGDPHPHPGKLQPLGVTAAGTSISFFYSGLLSILDLGGWGGKPCGKQAQVCGPDLPLARFCVVSPAPQAENHFYIFKGLQKKRKGRGGRRKNDEE